jgi:hypothetical protein
MSIYAYHAPTGADAEIYHQIHDAMRMLANAAGLLKRAEQAADAEEWEGVDRFNAAATDGLQQALEHAENAIRMTQNTQRDREISHAQEAI